MVLANIAKSLPNGLPYAGLIKNLAISLTNGSEGITLPQSYFQSLQVYLHICPVLCYVSAVNCVRHQLKLLLSGMIKLCLS